MQLPKLKGGKKEPKQYIDQTPFESLMDIVTQTKNSAVDELGKKIITDTWNQMVGANKEEQNQNGNAGDLSAGQELDLISIKKEVHKITEQGEDYVREIVHAGKKAASEESREIQVKVQEILIEIRQLAKSTKEVQAQVEVISGEQTVSNKGIYHVNFLEKMLDFLRDARLNVEDSLAWFQALRSKKASRQYGVLAKKHGNAFTLSQERTMATQTG